MEGRVSVGHFKLYITLIILLVVVCISGCASTSALNKENDAFNRALAQDTIDAYTLYIENNPDGVHVEAAKERIMELEWEEAEQAHTVEAYNGFIVKYRGSTSSSAYIKIAEERLHTLNEQISYKDSNAVELASHSTKSSKNTDMKKSKSQKNKETRVKLLSIDMGERLKPLRILMTTCAAFFIKLWQKIVTIFKSSYVWITNFYNEIVDAERFIRSR
jgi:uncharacterized coiled-coil protein SlyX